MTTDNSQSVKLQWAKILHTELVHGCALGCFHK